MNSKSLTDYYLLYERYKILLSINSALIHELLKDPDPLK